MGRVAIIGLLLTAACGRLGFEDGANPDTLDTSRKLTCGMPARFQVGAAGLSAMVGMATSRGFALLTVDTAKALRAWSYEWGPGGLEPNAQNAAVDSDVTGGLGAVGIGDDVLVAAIHGAGATLGSSFYPLTVGFTDRGPAVVRDGQVLGTVSIAKGGTASEVASASIQSGAVYAHRLDMNGSETSSRQIVPTGETPSEVSIASAGTGYVLTWVSSAPSPNITRAVLLDGGLGIVSGPITITNTTGFDTIRPRVVWSPVTGTYLVAWYEKTPTGDDDVFVQVFDGQLVAMTVPIRIAASAARVALAPDGAGYLVAYGDLATSRVQVAHVTTDGAFAMRPVGHSGGTAAQWTMIEREGQAVLAYAETNADGPDLWFDPVCN